MKEIKLYYVVSDVFGELLVDGVDDLDEAISNVQDGWANSGEMKLILLKKKVYIL
jgi:hypothetical protein